MAIRDGLDICNGNHMLNPLLAEYDDDESELCPECGKHEKNCKCGYYEW